MPNPFVHIELSTTNHEKAKSFYGQLFNWKLQDTPMGNGVTYTMIDPAGGTGGGMVKQMEAGAPSAWLAYIDVDDIRASTAKAKALGANIKTDVTEIPGMGWFSIVTDPTGATIGLWQTAKA